MKYYGLDPDTTMFCLVEIDSKGIPVKCWIKKKPIKRRACIYSHWQSEQLFDDIFFGEDTDKEIAIEAQQNINAVRQNVDPEDIRRLSIVTAVYATKAQRHFKKVHILNAYAVEKHQRQARTVDDLEWKAQLKGRGKKKYYYPEEEHRNSIEFPWEKPTQAEWSDVLDSIELARRAMKGEI